MLAAGYLVLSACAVLCEAACDQTRSPPFGPNITQYAVTGLPNVHYTLPASWAGQIRIPGTQDDALFFWLFEAEVPAFRNKLIIWLDGGPGCTSLAGLTKENGPLAFFGNATAPAPNPNSWTKLANVLYIDQPVGTGFSSGSSDALTNSQVTEEFYAWLTAFYAQFPVLKSMDTYLMGESYAGIFIPYFTAAILEDTKNLSIKIQSISLGDPAIGIFSEMQSAPIAQYVRQQNQILGIPEDILFVLENASLTCGYDAFMRDLQYPNPSSSNITYRSPQAMPSKLAKRQNLSPQCLALLAPTSAAQVNESIFSGCFGPCALWDSVNNYLSATNPCFSYDNIAYTCASTPNPAPVAAYLDLPAVKAAIHAPDKIITACNVTVQASLLREQVIPPTYGVLPGILEKMKVHIWSGDWDFLLPHLGTEVLLQRMVWNGLQGLQKPPTNPFRLNGRVVGNWAAERNLTYHHFLRAGHSTPYDRPAVAFAYVRDFVLNEVGYRGI